MKKRKSKLPVGILGTGNIGTDLLFKIQRSPYLSCVLFSGKNSESQGISKAKSLGIEVATNSIDAFRKKTDIALVFDATSAQAHIEHAQIFKELGLFTIDMTPSKIGILCVPLLNLTESLKQHNVNMISCGGQANTPIIKAIMDVHPEVSYVEVVSSISSYSAGLGTRNNIDEYTQTTSDAIMKLTGVAKAKTIIILNPAKPPIYMHNTIYAKVEKGNVTKLNQKILQAVAQLQQYVPGFKLIAKPMYDNMRLTVMTEVVGAGDHLPAYAGNLDIINCAAIAVAEAFAKNRM